MRSEFSLALPLREGAGGRGSGSLARPLPQPPPARGGGECATWPYWTLHDALPGSAAARREDRLRPGGRRGRGRPARRLARRRRGRRRRAPRARHRGDRGLLRRHRARPPRARPDPQERCSWKRSRPPPPSARSAWPTPGGGALRPGPDRRAVAADARATPRTAAATSTRAPRSSTLLDLGCIPVINENDTVATTEIRFGDNDRLAARVAEMTRRRPADPAVRHRRALHRRPAQRPCRRAPAGGRAHHRRDRGHGRRAAARLLVRRHAHQADRGPHRHPGGLRHGDRLRPRATTRCGRSRRARAAPGSSPRPRAAPPASAGSPARWRRSAPWWWTPARRAPSRRLVAAAGRRARRRGRFHRGDPVSVRDEAGRRWPAASRPTTSRMPGASPAIAAKSSRRSSAGAGATRSSTATTWCCCDRWVSPQLNPSAHFHLVLLLTTSRHGRLTFEERR